MSRFVGIRVTGIALLLGTTMIAGPVAAQSYEYTAQLRASASSQGVVTAAGIDWKCDGSACHTFGPWPQPGVFACHALAAKVGAVASYGRPGASLGLQQLAQCNWSLAAPQAMAQPVLIAKPMANAGAMAAQLRPMLLRDRLARFNLLVDQRAQAVNRVQKPGQAPLLQPPIMMAASPTPKHMVILSQGDDCDDLRSQDHPGAAEVCDGRDNNCDGVVDEGQTLVFFLDADGDGHGDPHHRIDACPSDQSAAAASGQWLVPVGNDCDDSNPDVWHDCH